MKKTFVLIILAVYFLMTSREVYAIKDSLRHVFQVSFNGGINQSKMAQGDFFLATLVQVKSYNFDGGVGYAYYNSFTDFDNVKDLLYQSHGIYGEVSYFITKGLFTGFRIQFDINRVDSESQQKFEQNRNITPPVIFHGRTNFLHLGYRQKLTSRIALQLKGQVGLHNYTMVTGSSYTGTPSPSFDQKKYPQEIHNDFLYAFNVGLVYKFL